MDSRLRGNDVEGLNRLKTLLDLHSHRVVKRVILPNSRAGLVAASTTTKGRSRPTHRFETNRLHVEALAKGVPVVPGQNGADLIRAFLKPHRT